MPTASAKSSLKRKARMRGATLIELVLIATVVLVVGGIAIPYFLQFSANLKLQTATAEVSDLMQRTRMLAAKNNAIYPLRFRTNSGTQQAYVDLNNDSTLDSGDPYIDLPKGITAASGAPSGSGQPTAYTLVGDTSLGTPYDNTNALAYSARGLPCEYSTPPTCSTPTSTYFVFYFVDGRPNGWSGVLVTKSGRTKTLFWNGSTWNY